jgi:hypothetical protein
MNPHSDKFSFLVLPLQQGLTQFLDVPMYIHYDLKIAMHAFCLVTPTTTSCHFGRGSVGIRIFRLKDQQRDNDSPKFFLSTNILAAGGDIPFILCTNYFPYQFSRAIYNS